eukprot:NODE_3308_length_370_cov_48.915888_g3226_i0.p1 GENE.NODE_3308_length_370_cov_48.915888_g3226_i0~~NODE_3308_length_370_cov_48.915888_g3226_i0.p1  ORF type:complete len:54 (+),score=4.97 NODE_3308_length_370_cov_48.915888_g3226_i0:76-237(+)
MYQSLQPSFPSIGDITNGAHQRCAEKLKRQRDRYRTVCVEKNNCLQMWACVVE